MRRLDRASLAPSQCLVARAAELSTLSDADAAAWLDADRSKRVSSAWLSMRAVLRGAQHGKCGWCESLLEERAIEIDHIRPKASALYWWLALDLDNLLAACRSCNNLKRDQWPLASGAQRLQPRQSPRTTAERALMLDPTVQDPGPYITFEFGGAQWRVVGRGREGRETVRVLQLDRNTLTTKLTYHAQITLDPVVRELHAADGAGDETAFKGAGRWLAGLAEPHHQWSAFNQHVLQAALEGNYRP